MNPDDLELLKLGISPDTIELFRLVWCIARALMIFVSVIVMLSSDNAITDWLEKITTRRFKDK